MVLPSGVRLGPYEIVAPLGAGGMGDVYRARDPCLGRDVAIKVLPDSFSRDSERLRRFERTPAFAADPWLASLRVHARFESLLTDLHVQETATRQALADASDSGPTLPAH